MAPHQLNEEELNNAFLNVRKAHRLIYEYQRRMQDLTWYIKNKLGFPNYKGFKQFSMPLSSRNTIYLEQWSWDWIYSYMYEYHLGSINIGNTEITLSLFQVSDNGFYKSRSESKRQTQVDSFASVEESDSLLTFYAVVKQNSNDYCKYDINKVSDTKPHVNSGDSYVEMYYPVPLQRFANEESTIEVLKEFVEYCKDNANVELEIIN